MKAFLHISDNEGDWEGLFLDGSLWSEGHSLDWPYLLPRMLNEKPECFLHLYLGDYRIEGVKSYEERLMDMGRFPNQWTNEEWEDLLEMAESARILQGVR